MKLNIEKTASVKTRKFGNISPGTVFEYEGCMWLKIARAHTVNPNAFDLSNNLYAEFAGKDEVIPVKSAIMDIVTQ